MLPPRSNDNANGRRQAPPVAINGVDAEHPLPPNPMVGSTGMGERPNEGTYAPPQRRAPAGVVTPSSRLNVGVNGRRQVSGEEANGNEANLPPFTKMTLPPLLVEEAVRTGDSLAKWTLVRRPPRQKPVGPAEPSSEHTNGRQQIPATATNGDSAEQSPSPPLVAATTGVGGGPMRRLAPRLAFQPRPPHGSHPLSSRNRRKSSGERRLGRRRRWRRTPSMP